jgi:signal transduction histidine kinase
VQVEEVMVDNTPVVRPLPQSRQSVAAPIVIPPGAHRLEIRYTAINLTASRKSRFRYRLEGADPGWSDAGEQRTAVYYRLPPGNYRFQVSAANKYGLWNSAGASVAFLVQPHWWQTLPFRIGAGALLLGLLWFSRSIKLRQLHRERTRRDEFARRLIESQETERKRIAGELHDSMGQDLILIKNAANLTLRKFTPDPPVQERLSEMADLASHALSNARAITSNLRPPELDRLGLTAALEAMLDKHAEHSGIQFVSTIDNVDGLWPPEQEINVYRVVQESLNNALKHAGPRRIEVEVKRLEAEVKMTVIDDGCGFDTEASLASGRRLGMGLTGLEERVRILGGEMELTSARGAGTSLRYRIPVPGHGKI